MPFETEGLFTGLEVPNFGGIVSRTGGKSLTIRGESYAQDVVGMPIKAEGLFAGLEVPNFGGVV